MSSRKTISLFAAAAALTILATTAVVQSQNDRKPPAPAPAKPTDKTLPSKTDHEDPMDQAMLEAMTPGPAHAQLAKYVGEWTTVSKMTAPGMSAEETIGTCKITSALGGRFFTSDCKGTMMGMPCQSTHYTGYNNGTKQYEAVWSYTMATGLMYLVGASDDHGKTINWNAKYNEKPGEPETLNVITRHVDDDHFTIEMRSEGIEGGEGPCMQVSYTRKK